MSIEVLINYLPWIASIIGIVASFFVVNIQAESSDVPYSNYVTFFSGLISAVVAYSFFEFPNNYFIAIIFACGSLASLASKTKMANISSLMVSMFASFAFISPNQTFAIASLSAGAILSSFSLDLEERKDYITIISILSILAVLGSTIPIIGGTLFVSLFVVWLAFIYPFSVPLPDESNATSLILRLSVLVVGALSIKNVNVHLEWLIAVSLIICSLKTLLEENKNSLIYLGASSSAILFLQPNISPYIAISHALAISGWFFAVSNGTIDRIARFIFVLSLAGAPLLGGFWNRWMAIKQSQNPILSIFIIINSISWIYFIISKKDFLPTTRPNSSFNNVIVMISIALIILLGIVGI